MPTYNDLQQQITKGNPAPVYFLSGDETFYIDSLLEIFENNILKPEERDFNLIVLYGKETSWQDVINAARRFPMFAEKMVVILKEAAQLRDIAQLESYLLNPAPTTVLVIDYRNKELDKRTKFAKAVNEKSVSFVSKKLKEEDVPHWIIGYGKEQGYVVPEREAEMLAVYLGNDLQKISNELEKIKINEPQLQQLSAQLIEKYIGISKEYNLVDLPSVVFSGDTQKLSRMLNYFAANPKSAPMAMVIGIFYAFTNKMYLSHYSPANFSTDRQLGIWQHHRQMAKKLSLSYVHKLMGIVEEYSHKSVGVDNMHHDTELLKEMTGKMLGLLYGYA